MSRYNQAVRLSVRDIVLQVITVLVGTLAVVAVMPHEGESSLRYEVGRPWTYSRLIAEKDFAILKTDDQLQHERDSLRLQYEPYFESLAQVENQQVTLFREQYKTLAVTEFPAQCRNVLERRLHDIYQRGIVSEDDWAILQEVTSGHVRVYRGVAATRQTTSELLTLRTAYNYLMNTADSTGLSRSRMQQLDLNQFLQPNLIYNQTRSDEQWDDLLSQLTPASGVVMAGQSIIDRGDIVDETKYQILQSYERDMRGGDSVDGIDTGVLLGQGLYVGIILITLIIFFNFFRRDYIHQMRASLLVATMMTIFVLATSFLVRHTLLSVYVIPFAMLPVFVRIFLDSRTAFFVHVATIMLCALPLSYPYEFITTQCVAGLVAIFTLRDLTRRAQIFHTVFWVTLTSVLFYLSIDLSQGHGLTGGSTFVMLDRSIYKHILWSGVLLLIAYPGMLLLERLFGFTSNVTLIELSNMNSGLLRRLSEVAPGTFQHSMQVSNLAAEVANQLGAKTQLVRTGAMYHDIGKMTDPAFFTENADGATTPIHRGLDEKAAARIVTSHVTEGLRIAEHENLPRVIREFISTHHGRGVAKYFYTTYRNNHPGEDVDRTPFSYAGPNPFTTEQAILMMADAVEASARSLLQYTEEAISALVDKIIDGQVADGFFADCPITFRDITTAKTVFKEKLKTLYHTRIAYPEEKVETKG